MSKQKSIDDTCVHEWISHPEILTMGFASQCKHCKEWKYDHPELDGFSTNTNALESSEMNN